MKALKLIAMILTLAKNAAFASGGTIVAPNDARNQEGNDQSSVPFTIRAGETARYQQVFDASQFIDIFPA